MRMNGHPPARAGESKCIVCGCTDSSPCDEGCGWAVGGPPVCSSCVREYMLAELWAIVFSTESAAKGLIAREIDGLRTLYSRAAKNAANGLPTLKRICQINRNADRWAQKQRTRGARK